MCRAVKKHHPDVKFDFHLNTTLHAIPGLIFGMSDIGPMGRQITFPEMLSFQREHNRMPTGIVAACAQLAIPCFHTSVVRVNLPSPASAVLSVGRWAMTP